MQYTLTCLVSELQIALPLDVLIPPSPQTKQDKWQKSY